MQERIAALEASKGAPASSSASTHLGSTSSASGLTHNPAQAEKLKNHFIIGRFDGVPTDLILQYVSKLITDSGISGLAIANTEIAKPRASFVFVLFQAYNGSTQVQMGFKFKHWLDANSVKPISPSTGEIDGTADNLWTQPHRDQAERERRQILNGPKAYLHMWRKEFGVSETYQASTSTMRTIGGAFTPQKENVQLKGQVIGKFHTTLEAGLQFQWESPETLSNVLGSTFHSSAKPWNAPKFLELWDKFDSDRRAKLS